MTLDLAEEDAPGSRPREPSHTVGLAANNILKSLLRSHLDGHLDDQARSGIGDLVQELVDSQVEEIKSAMTQAQHQASKDAPNARPSVWPWVSVLIVVCVAISAFGAIMWGGLGDLQEQRIADHAKLAEETRLRNEQRSEDLNYDRQLAHWLVLSHDDTFKVFKNQDTLLRAIAKAVDVDVDIADIKTPAKREPPREVSVKHLQAQPPR